MLDNTPNKTELMFEKLANFCSYLLEKEFLIESKLIARKKFEIVFPSFEIFSVFSAIMFLISMS